VGIPKVEQEVFDEFDGLVVQHGHGQSRVNFRGGTPAIAFLTCLVTSYRYIRESELRLPMQRPVFTLQIAGVDEHYQQQRKEYSKYMSTG
jgi:hypothetical protein